MYSCDICKKEFKTTQHLNQHKNKKKACSLNSSGDQLTKVIPPLKNNELSSDDIMKFISTYKTFQDLIKDKEMLAEYKEKLIALQNENNMLKEQIKLINNIINNNTENKIKEVTAKASASALVPIDRTIYETKDNNNNNLVFSTDNNNNNYDYNYNYNYNYDDAEGFSPDMIITKIFD